VPTSTHWLSFIFALLALACAPVSAQADSGESQYEDVTPTACGDAPCERGSLAAPSGSDTPSSGTASNATDGDPAANGGQVDTDDGGETGSQKETRNLAGQKSGKDGSPKPQASGALSPVPSEEGDDDGSSPLVPILLAIAALAALSAGVLVYRHRHRLSAEAPSK
jgi:hypothetical protein